MAEKKVVNRKPRKPKDPAVRQSIDKIDESMGQLKDILTKSVDEQKKYFAGLTDNTVLKDAYLEAQEKFNEMLIGKKIDNVRSNTKYDVNIFKDLYSNKQTGNNPWATNTTDSLVKRKIIQYRELSRNPELRNIIGDIVNEAIVVNSYDEFCVKTKLDETYDAIKKFNPNSIVKIDRIFKTILHNLSFDTEGTDMFRMWFVDGRLYIRRLKNSNGDTIGYDVLDPLNLDLIVPTNSEDLPYYSYTNNPEMPVMDEGINHLYSSFSGTSNLEVEEIEYEDVVVIYSGEYDHLLKIYISQIESSIKTLNQLNNLEDAMLLHQFIRAVSRRLFKVYTGTLNHNQREKVLNYVQKRHKESFNLKYNTSTGEIEGEEKVKYLSLFDDYWLAVGDNDSTSIENLDGSAPEWDTITEKLSYFRRKLYRAMNVPFSRFESQEQQGGEYKLNLDTLERQERKYQKYITDLRKKFGDLFYQLLEKEVLSQNLFNNLEWRLLKKRINIIWEDDNYFTQLKKYLIVERQADVISKIEPMIGKWFSKSFVHKEILNRNDEDIKILEQQLGEEKLDSVKKGEVQPGAEGGEMGMGGEMGGGAEGGGGLDLSNISFDTPPEPEAAPPEAEAPAPPEGTI